MDYFQVQALIHHIPMPELNFQNLIFLSCPFLTVSFQHTKHKNFWKLLQDLSLVMYSHHLKNKTYVGCPCGPVPPTSIINDLLIRRIKNAFLVTVCWLVLTSGPSLSFHSVGVYFYGYLLTNYMTVPL